MNNMEYLQQISSSTKEKNTKNSSQGFDFFQPKVLIGVGAVFVFSIILIIVGLGGKKEANSDPFAMALKSIQYRGEKSAEVFTDYLGYVKSRDLRNQGNNLTSVFTALKADTERFIEEYEENENSKLISDAETTAQAEQEENSTELEATLKKAKINGILDRNFAHSCEKETSQMIISVSQAINQAPEKYSAHTEQLYEKNLANLKTVNEYCSSFSEAKD